MNRGIIQPLSSARWLALVYDRASEIILGKTSEAMLPADGVAGKLAVAENPLTAKIGGFHFAAQNFTEIRGDRMAKVQAVFGDDESAFGVEDYEVGVVACGEAALAFVAAGQSCWSLGHPAHDIGERETALRGFGVHQRKCDGKAGDAAPGGAEISFGEAFHFGWAGRMIGGDEVDGSIAKGLPQLLTIVAIANWWGALEEGGSLRNGLRGEMKIVRAGFYSYGQTFGARGAEFG